MSYFGEFKHHPNMVPLSSQQGFNRWVRECVVPLGNRNAGTLEPWLPHGAFRPWQALARCFELEEVWSSSAPEACRDTAEICWTTEPQILRSWGYELEEVGDNK